MPQYSSSDPLYMGGAGLRGIHPDPAGGAAWDPSQLTNLELWLKPEDLPAVSSTVGTWADSSGNSRDLTQGTEASKPVVVSGLDGNKAAQFDGVDDVMYEATASLATTPFNLYAIVYPDLQETGLHDFGASNPDSYPTGDNLVFRTNALGDTSQVDLIYLAGTVTLTMTGPTTVNQNWDRWRWELQEGANASSVYWGGGSSTLTGTLGSRTLQGFKLGGYEFSTSKWFNKMQVAEVLITGDLTAQEVTDIDSYFAAKYPSLGL